MRKLPLHLQILTGILIGVIVGITFSLFPWGKGFVVDWIKPFGTLFINTLKLIAIPLIITSLLNGITNLKDLTQVSSMGKKTLGIYLLTTVIALFLGLAVVNSIKPGSFVGEETRNELIASYEGDVSSTVDRAEALKNRAPLQPLIDIVPENLFQALSANSNMLQVIFFTMLCGFAIMSISQSHSRPLVSLFESANMVVLKIVDMIMAVAPFGVFALMATLVAEAPSTDIFVALAIYGLTVLLGLAIMVYVVYALIARFWGGANIRHFFKSMMPAKLLAFSTSSSAATLPVTMECVNDRLGVDKEVSSFVLPIGTTINMDGTSLYQAVAAIFIAQVMGDDLTFGQQMTVVITAALASIGSAPVPGAGILMLVIVLESIGVNPAGLALILAIDRPLDMCRTTVNVVGDAVICVVVSKLMGKELKPKVIDPEL